MRQDFDAQCVSTPPTIFLVVRGVFRFPFCCCLVAHRGGAEWGRLNVPVSRLSGCGQHSKRFIFCDPDAFP